MVRFIFTTKIKFQKKDAMGSKCIITECKTESELAQR